MRSVWKTDIPMIAFEVMKNVRVPLWIFEESVLREGFAICSGAKAPLLYSNGTARVNSCPDTCFVDGRSMVEEAAGALVFLIRVYPW